MEIFLRVLEILVFISLTATVFYFAFKQFKQVYDNIMRGQPEHINSTFGFRLKSMLIVAVGQKKMFKLTFPALLHIVIYSSFIITQIELVEIFLDGITGGHRTYLHLVEGTPLQTLYVFIVNFIEFLSLMTFIVTIIFILRRTTFKVARFQMPELKGWPWKDALLILTFELILITFIFMMNGADSLLKIRETGTGYGFILSQFFASPFSSLPTWALVFFEKLGWWGHYLMVLTFLLYLPYSKHLHILLAFPNTFFTRPEPKGEIHNMPAIQHEVQSMLDPAFKAPEQEGEIKFGDRKSVV